MTRITYRKDSCVWDLGSLFSSALIFGERGGGEGVYHRDFLILITEIRKLTAQGFLLPERFLIKSWDKRTFVFYRKECRVDL